MARTESFTSVAGGGQLAPDDWEEDKPACSICTARFGLLNRRHHCRMCGKCVCEACSPNRVQLVEGRSSKRVCLPCVGASNAALGGSPMNHQGSIPMGSQGTMPEMEAVIVDPEVSKGLRTELVHVQDFLDKFAHRLEGLLDLAISADSVRIPDLDKLRPDSFPSIEIDEAIRRCEVCIQPITHALKLLAGNGEKAPASFQGDTSVVGAHLGEFASELKDKLLQHEVTVAQEDLRLAQDAQQTCTIAHAVEDETDGPVKEMQEDMGAATTQAALVEIGLRLQRFTIDIAPLVQKPVPVYDTDDPIQTCGMVLNVLDDFAPELKVCIEKEHASGSALADMSVRLEKLVAASALMVHQPVPSYNPGDSIESCWTALAALEDIVPALRKSSEEFVDGQASQQLAGETGLVLDDGYGAADGRSMKEKMAARSSKVLAVDEEDAAGFANWNS